MTDPTRISAHSTQKSIAHTGLWSKMARLWKLAASPLRPSPEDINQYRHFVDSWISDHGAPRVLLLGVTPDLYRLPWPSGTDLLAIDQNQEMIDLVWPGPVGAAQCSSWIQAELPNRSRDLALCDGGLHLLNPREQHALVDTLYEVLSPEGICVFRLFAPKPENHESVETVWCDLEAGNISGVNALKLRLDLALQCSYEEGVQLGSVWTTFQKRFPDRGALASTIGWPVETFEAIDIYRDSTSMYHFPSVEEARHLFCGKNQFTLVASRIPSYKFGESSPTVCFRRGD